MSNGAADRLRLHYKSHDGPCQYCRVVARVDVRDALAHERSAGAAPLDERRLLLDFAASVAAQCNDPRLVRDANAILARLSEGTDR